MNRTLTHQTANSGSTPDVSTKVGTGNAGATTPHASSLACLSSPIAASPTDL